MSFVVIPAYQPDNKLIKLLQGLRKESLSEIIVIDDGSKDESVSIIEQAKEYATVLKHETNKGKGEALKTAFDYINKRGVEGVVVTADADGQHAIDDIQNVTDNAKNNPNNLVLGVRQFSKDIPFRSRFGNILTKFAFKLNTGKSVSDTQTGLRGFHTNMLPFMLEIDGKRYEYEMNMLTEATKNYEISEVPIQTIYIEENESSHFRPIKDGLIIYKNLFKFALSSLFGFLVDYLIYAIAIFFISNKGVLYELVIANTLARLVSATTNYKINKTLVFNNKGSIAKTGLEYFSLAVFIYLADTGLLYIFHDNLGINIYLVKIVVGIILFILSWLVQKYIIFKER